MQHYARELTLDGVVKCIRLDADNKPILLGLDEVVSTSLLFRFLAVSLIHFNLIALIVP